MSAELAAALNIFAEQTRTGLAYAVALETECGSALPVGTVVATKLDGVFTISEGSSADLVAVLCRPGVANAYSGYTGSDFLTTTEAVVRLNERGHFVPLQRTVLVGYDAKFHVYSVAATVDVLHTGNMANRLLAIGRTVELSTGPIWVPTQQLYCCHAEWRVFRQPFGYGDRRALQKARRLQQNKRSSLLYRGISQTAVAQV